MRLPIHIFREYDIRGNADKDLSNEVVESIAAGLCWWLARHGVQKMALGRDGRLHSPRIHQAFLKTALSLGMDIIDIGVVPTPLLYFATRHLGVQAGVQITGSHNPGSDNGFKIAFGQGTLHGTTLQEIRQRIEQGPFEKTTDLGVIHGTSIDEAYMAYVVSCLRLGKNRGKVVVDAGNGTGGPVLVPLLQQLGFEVVPLYCEVDGHFPHHHPDPTVPENLQDLQQAVIEHRADIGLALDGDADRLGAVDNLGRIVWGDQLLILLAKALLQEKPGACFVAEVKCSQTVYEEIRKAGGVAIMGRVGHSLIKEKMKEVSADLAGEMSGHIFFQHRYLGYDDGIYAACRLLELLTHTDSSFSTLVDALPKRYNTPEIRRLSSDETKFLIVDQFIQKARTWQNVTVIDIDGARVEWTDGWALVRASNTQPALVMRFEAHTAERLAEIQSLVEKTLDIHGRTSKPS